MIERQHITQVLDYGRLLSMEELMRYTSLGKNTATDLAKSANAIVRVGKRVVYDRKKIDSYIDSQGQDR